MAHLLAAGSSSVLRKLQFDTCNRRVVKPASTPRCRLVPCSPNWIYRNTPRDMQSAIQAVRADQQTEALDAAVVQAIASITQAVDESVKAALTASAEAAKTVTVTVNSEVRSKVVNGVEKLQKGLLERETEVRVAAVTADQHSLSATNYIDLSKVTSHAMSRRNPPQNNATKPFAIRCLAIM